MKFILRTAIVSFALWFVVTIGQIAWEFETREPKSRSITIADKEFLVPEDWKYWRNVYWEEGDDPAYWQLDFVIDVRTYENIKANYKEPYNLHIEIRPIRSEFGEVNYWTEKSSIHKSKIFNCKPHIFENKEYEFCQHESKNRLQTGVDDAYSLKDKKTGNYMSVFGCKEPFPEDSNLNDTCSGRTLLLDNIQIEYVYRAEYAFKALEIDHKVREIGLSLYVKPE
jgi:hypothetical protein